MPVLRWSPTKWRRIEAVRDRVFFRLGSSEPVIPASDEELAGLLVTRQWRRPLSIEEINQMAPTVEVRARLGRP